MRSAGTLKGGWRKRVRGQLAHFQAMQQSWWRNHFFRTDERKERERAFLENGSKLLEKLIVSCNGKPILIRSFSAQGLRLATNNYNSHYGFFWYKGSLEGRIVFIRKFPDHWANLAINDQVISAQMSAHSNVLKPIGCCLETPSPILVYEFTVNGFLADQIYVSRVTQRQHQPKLWESRLNIAWQIAHAISYLHSAFDRPVVHMYINMYSILLDEHDVPKLSSFLVSVSIPEGETDVEGYEGLRNSRFSTPELEASAKVTEKTDVYLFGVLLLEILTGEDSYNMIRFAIDKDSTLAAYMHNCAQRSCIKEIVDPAILAREEGASLEGQLKDVLDLALTCTEEDPQRRPNIGDVTKQLRRIERFIS